MLQSMTIAASLVALLVAVSQPTPSQASKKLEGRTKGTGQDQQKSWQQVDEINKETDKTKSRSQQAQKNVNQSSQKSRSTTKTTVGTGRAPKKSPPPKHTPVPPKK